MFCLSYIDADVCDEILEVPWALSGVSMGDGMVLQTCKGETEADTGLKDRSKMLWSSGWDNKVLFLAVDEKTAADGKTDVLEAQTEACCSSGEMGWGEKENVWERAFIFGYHVDWCFKAYD